MARKANRMMALGLGGPDSRLLTDQQWVGVAAHAGLTPRELQVCQTLFGCGTREQIAEEFGISPRTVRNHMEQIHLKLDVRNRVGVVLRIVQLRDFLGDRARTSDVRAHDSG